MQFDLWEDHRRTTSYRGSVSLLRTAAHLVRPGFTDIPPTTPGHRTDAGKDSFIQSSSTPTGDVDLILEGGARGGHGSSHRPSWKAMWTNQDAAVAAAYTDLSGSGSASGPHRRFG